MAKPSEQELKEFANALQLSIDTKISGILRKDDGIVISFDAEARGKDARLEIFLRVFGTDGVWSEQGKVFVVSEAHTFSWSKLSLFLLLTRMDEENILKLAELDAFAAETAEKFGLKTHDVSLDSIAACAKRISEKMKQKGMTIRELSEASGLTQVSISNFRSGKDVRLSSLLKLVKALGMSLRIK